jgi:ribokinase
MQANHPSIVVVGSSNTDMVVNSPRLPSPGETILGGHFLMNGGGKGANQAVAAVRLGGNVTLIAKTGDDIFGRQAIDAFRAEGIDTRYMATDQDNPSGIALITVDDKGENTIVVAAGANAALVPADLIHAKGILQGAVVVLVQLEIPLETVEWLAKIREESNGILILNPAPARQLSETLLQRISIITPNETEATILTGIQVQDKVTATRAAKKLREKGIKKIIITMGAEGALLLDKDEPEFIQAPKVKAVDTTAAGDVFNGALALGIAEGLSLAEAVRFGCQAASLSVTRRGAQTSAPFRHEIALK